MFRNDGEANYIQDSVAIPVPRTQTRREKLFAIHNALCSDALNLMKKKNVDYAEVDDPYENFRQFGRFGILVRLGDKFARLKNFERNGKFAVEDEGVKDTIIDIINYAVLYFGYDAPKEGNRV